MSKKGKGGTGRGTDSKGWTRWDKAAKKKSAKRVFGKGGQGAKGIQADRKTGGEAKSAIIEQK